VAQLTVTVRDADMDTLSSIAERQWRTNEQQLSALIEQALNNARTKADSAPRRTRRNGQ
jgi:hypothetical protein